MATQTLKIDTAFAGIADEQLANLIEDGWKIIDKSIMRDRYIYYILNK